MVKKSSRFLTHDDNNDVYVEVDAYAFHLNSKSSYFSQLHIAYCWENIVETCSSCKSYSYHVSLHNLQCISSSSTNSWVKFFMTIWLLKETNGFKFQKSIFHCISVMMMMMMLFVFPRWCARQQVSLSSVFIIIFVGNLFSFHSYSSFYNNIHIFTFLSRLASRE